MQLSSYNSSSNASILATCVGVPFQSFTDAYSTGKAIVVSARSGATVFPKFETALGARPLGRHRVSHSPKEPEVFRRSGATVFFRTPGGTWRSLARAPPCFFLRVPFAPARSGATVFFTLRERLE